MTHVYPLNWAAAATLHRWRCCEKLSTPVTGDLESLCSLSLLSHALAFVLSICSKTSVCKRTADVPWLKTWVWFELMTIAHEHFPLSTSASYKPKLTWGLFQKRNNIHFPKRGCSWGFTESLSSFTAWQKNVIVFCELNVSYLCIPLQTDKVISVAAASIFKHKILRKESTTFFSLPF